MPQLSSIAALAAAAVIALAAAYPTKEDDIYYSRLHELPVLEYRQEPRNLDGIGGGNLLKDLDALRTRAALLSRDSRGAGAGHYMDVLGGNTLGGVKRSGCCDSLSGIGIGSEKRNMDEIDRSSFNSFVKRNFDEIDRSGFGGFVKKNFDEIDRSGFGSFVKRSAPPAPAEAHN